MVAGARRCPIRYFYYEVKCSLWITTTLWFLPNFKEVYLQIISTKSIFWNYCKMAYNFMIFRNISLSILFKNISHLNLKYFIASEILYRVFFILLMCQLDFLFAVFFPFSFRYFFELLLSSSWLDMTLFHKAARNSPMSIANILFK